VFAFNFFQPVTNAMLGLLKAIHSVIPSYGLDMVLLALVVRLALFPLAQQQFKSMAEMQKVQPLLKKIQVEFKPTSRANRKSCKPRRWRSTRNTASIRWPAASRC
jgi:YidC/Oxa1 family membrane protein insertase